MFLEELVQPIWEGPRGKGSFIRSVAAGGRMLDVGCGNNSP